MTPQQINQLATRYGLELRDPNRPELGWVRSPQAAHSTLQRNQQRRLIVVAGAR